MTSTCFRCLVQVRGPSGNNDNSENKRLDAYVLIGVCVDYSAAKFRVGPSVVADISACLRLPVCDVSTVTVTVLDGGECGAEDEGYGCGDRDRAALPLLMTVMALDLEMRRRPIVKGQRRRRRSHRSRGA